jgi:2-(1,2-epoxy-1,2-dihydrophenyl)acetyl-CoA isomerase
MAFVTESFEDHLSTIVLSRAERKNALSSDLLKALLQALLRAKEKGARVTILRGSGGSFSSGGDLREFYETEDTASRVDHVAMMLNEVIKGLRYMPSIVIAVVEGVAYGAGLSMALACDLVVATEEAKFNLAYRRIGLTPDGGASIFLPRLLGDKRFNALYLFSKDLTAREAEGLGLVNFVFRAEELEERLEGIVKDLLMLPHEAIPYYKRLVNQSLFFGMESHLERERLFVAELSSTQTFRTAVGRFLKGEKDA